MVRSVSIKPNYIPLTQQRLCCVPCAVQWILLRRKLPMFSQEEIGKALNLTIPPKYKNLFPKGFVRVSSKKPILGYGSQTSDKANAYNKFFRAKRIPLQTTYISLSKLEEPVRVIATNLKEGNDVMIITHMSALDRKKQWGHALIASSITLGKNPTIVVGDPHWDAPKFYKVPLEKVLLGMTKKVGKAERGIYIFKKI